MGVDDPTAGRQIDVQLPTEPAPITVGDLGWQRNGDTASTGTTLLDEIARLLQPR
jgi:hypothetical protein